MPMYDFNPYNTNYNNAYNPYMRQVTGLNGKMVTRLEDIAVQDVPTNGDCGIFPTTDYSTIYLKKWNPNGTIATVAYKPQIEPKANEATILSNAVENPLNEAITKQLEDINNKLSKLMEANYEYSSNDSRNDATVAK